MTIFNIDSTENERLKRNEPNVDKMDNNTADAENKSPKRNKPNVDKEDKNAKGNENEEPKKKKPNINKKGNNIYYISSIFFYPNFFLQKIIILLGSRPGY